MIQINLDSAKGFYDQQEYTNYINQVPQKYTQLANKNGKGNDFLGWLDLPLNTENKLISDINESAKRLSQLSDFVVVIGIGGSYLGAKAVIEALNHHFESYMNRKTQVVFSGFNICSDHLSDLIDLIRDKDFSLVVISKSGTTTEPAISFRVLKNLLEKKYGKENSKDRIVSITDKSKGALKTLSENEGYQTFTIPDDVGGRFSVLTPVGLLPIALAGFSIEKLLQGAKDFYLKNNEILDNSGHPVSQYVAARNVFYNQNRFIEMLVNYHPRLHYFTEWWKQLYGESEGKERKGIFPTGANFTTDLHSLGQYIQDGKRNLFETVLKVENTNKDILIPEDEQNLDSLNYISGKTLQFVNHKAMEGTMMAHVDGGVPNIQLSIPKVDEYNLGQLIYFFEISCALSGYVLDVNPFDQPGVEAYKRNMFQLLGKPGV
jgi:glucose-6-phosphate isomerase